MDAPKLSSTDVEELAQYRQLSWLAVTALGFGLLSFLAIFSVAAWLLPIVAVGTGAAALRAISREDSGLSGRKAAMGGLALGLLFGGWGMSAFALEQWLIYRQARQHSAYWLELVREGDLYRAHQLHLSHWDRIAPHQSLTGHYEAKPKGDQPEAGMQPILTPLEELEVFFKQEPLKTMVAQGEQATIRYDGSRRITMAGPDDRVGQRYSLIYRQDGQQHIVPFTIQVTRTYDPQSKQYFWKVTEVVPRGDEKYFR